MVDLRIDKITVQALPEDMARKIDETHSMVLAIFEKVNAMADTADQILEGVGRMQTKVASLEALTDKLFGLYSELRQDPAKLQQVLNTVAEIEAGADAAIARNTPEDAGGGTDTGGGTGDGEATPASEPVGDGGSTEFDVKP